MRTMTKSVHFDPPNAYFYLPVIRVYTSAGRVVIGVLDYRSGGSETAGHALARVLGRATPASTPLTANATALCQRRLSRN
jgi:hypothetical protein